MRQDPAYSEVVPACTLSGTACGCRGVGSAALSLSVVSASLPERVGHVCIVSDTIFKAVRAAILQIPFVTVVEVCNNLQAAGCNHPYRRVCSVAASPFTFSPLHHPLITVFAGLPCRANTTDYRYCQDCRKFCVGVKCESESTADSQPPSLPQPQPCNQRHGQSRVPESQHHEPRSFLRCSLPEMV